MAEEFLDEQPMGGLGSMQTESTKEVEPKESPRTTEAERRISAEQKRLNETMRIEAHIDRLMKGLEERNQSPINEKYLALAEGFLAPTKTGGFGESAGAAAGRYREVAAEERKRLTDMDKAKLELMLQKYNLSQKDYELQKAIEGREFRRNYFNQGQPTGGINTAATAATDATGAPSLQSIIDRGQSSRGVREITLADIANAPDSEVAFLEKMYDDQQNAKKIQQGEYAPTKTFLPLLNEPTEMLTVKQRRELDLIKDANISEDLRNKYYMEWYAKNGLLPKVATDAAHPVSVKDIETPQQKQKRLKIEESTESERGKENVKRQSKDITSYNDEAKLGGNMAVSAKQMYDFASDPALEGMFGLLQKKGLTNAFFTAMKEPLKIGSVSIGIGNIEDVIRIAGGTNEQIEAAKAFKKPASEAELAFTRIYLAKEGQVTEGERVIVRNVIPTLEETAKTVRLKSELMIARAQFDQQKADLFNAYIKNNPSATAFDFEHDSNSPYKTLLKQYQQHTADISNEYMPGSVKDPFKPVRGQPIIEPKKSSLWNRVQEKYKE